MKDTIGTVLTVQKPVEARETTSLTDLMIWCYCNQMIRRCYEQREPGLDTRSMTAIVCHKAKLGEVPSSSPGAVLCHPDAEYIHELILKHPSFDSQLLLIRSAETQSEPLWDRKLEPAKMVPVLRANGKPKMITHPVNRRPVACRMKRVGYTEEERKGIIQGLRDDYSLWYHALIWLHKMIDSNDQLTRWKVSSIGVEKEPWNVLS